MRILFLILSLTLFACTESKPTPPPQEASVTAPKDSGSPTEQLDAGLKKDAAKHK